MTAHRASTRRSPKRLAAITAAALAVSGLTLAPAQAADPLAASDDILSHAWTDGDQLTLTLQGNLLANDRAPAGAVITDVAPVSGAGEPDWDVAWSPDGDVTITHTGSWSDGEWSPLGAWEYRVETPGGAVDFARLRASLTPPGPSPRVVRASVDSLQPATIRVLDGTRGPLSYPVPPSGEVGSFSALSVVSVSEGIASAAVGADGQTLDVAFDAQALGDRSQVNVMWRLKVSTGDVADVTLRIDVPERELERPFDLASLQPGLEAKWGDGDRIDLTLEGNWQVRGDLFDLTGVEPHDGVTVEVTDVAASEGWQVDSWTPDGEIAVTYTGSWADTWAPTGDLTFGLQASTGWTGKHHAEMRLATSDDWDDEKDDWMYVLDPTERGTTRLFPDLDRAPIVVPTDSGARETRFRAIRIVEFGPAIDDARIVNDGRAVEVDIAEGYHQASMGNTEYWVVIRKMADTGGPPVTQRLSAMVDPEYLGHDDVANGTVETPIEVDVLANDITLWKAPYREAPLDVVEDSLPAGVTAQVTETNHVEVTVPRELADEPVKFRYRVEGAGGNVDTPTVTVTAVAPSAPEPPTENPEPEPPREETPRIDAGL